MPEFPPVPARLPENAEDSNSLGLEGVGQAFGRAVKSQLHPRMLLAMLLPFVIMFVGAIVLLLVALGPLTAWMDRQITESATVLQADQWLVSLGLFSVLTVKAWLLPVASVVILLPVSGILGLAVAAVCVMPMVISHLSGTTYASLRREGRNSFVVSLWNAVWVSILFALGWILTLPLWLAPPLGLVVSVFWWAFAFCRMMRIDAIVEHASPAERRLLLARHSTALWGIGLICALINLIPPAWVFLPVFSGLVYTHFGLSALARLRAQRGQVD